MVYEGLSITGHQRQVAKFINLKGPKIVGDPDITNLTSLLIDWAVQLPLSVRPAPTTIGGTAPSIDPSKKVTPKQTPSSASHQHNNLPLFLLLCPQATKKNTP